MTGGTQTPFQTGSTAIASVKPMVVSGPTANYPSGTMYLLTTQTSTTLRLLTYTNTGNLASNAAPTLASQRTVSSSISVGGSGSYGNAVLSSGTQFDGGDDRLIGLSYANGRMLASCTSYYGSTSASPKVRGFEEGEKRKRKVSFKTVSICSVSFFSRTTEKKKGQGRLLVYRRRHGDAGLRWPLRGRFVERLVRENR